MAFTIARTAGKLATSPSRPATVSADPQSFQLEIDSDPRLASAAGGAARFVSELAGLESSESQRFQKAVVTACLEAFQRLGATHLHVTVTTTRFPDRIEVSLAYRPASPATKDPGGNTASGKPASNSSLEGVDQIQREVHGSAAVIRLTKYLRTAQSGE